MCISMFDNYGWPISPGMLVHRQTDLDFLGAENASFSTFTEKLTNERIFDGAEHVVQRSEISVKSKYYCLVAI